MELEHYKNHENAQKVTELFYLQTDKLKYRTNRIFLYKFEIRKLKTK